MPLSSALADRIYKFAVDMDYPPFSYKDPKTGKLTGFDTDIAWAVCKKLNIKCEVLGVSFDEIIPMVEKGELDVGCAGFAWNEERAKRVIFTDKYYRSSSLFIQRSGTFDEISDSVLKGKAFSVQEGTNQQFYLNKTYGQSITVIPFDSFEAVMKAVEDGQVDLALIDGLPGYDYLKSDAGQELDIAGDPVHLDNGSCMVVNKDMVDLRDNINKAINELRLSGEYDEINIKYFEFNVY
jgi:ABC-type amino acid transport substrate-binding protein